MSDETPARERPVLNDPRVVESWGGGWAPEQHTGTLTDGRRFYFRTRHGYAGLHVNTVEACDADFERDKALRGTDKYYYDDRRDGKSYPPCTNPDFDSEEFDRAYEAGREYGVSFWSDETADENLPDSEDFGAFMSQRRRDESFTRLLNEIEARRQS